MLAGALRLFTGGLVGKFLGVAREGLLAYLYGTSDVVAANRIAQTAVLSPLNLATTDALSSAFLPLEAKLLKERPQLAIAFYRGVQLSILGFGALVMLVMLLGADRWVNLFAPGLGQSTAQLAASMTVILALGIPSYLHFGMLAYLEMAHQSYKLISVRASAQSIGLIVGTIAGFWLGRPSLLVWGFSGCYLLMSVWGMRYVRRRGYLAGAGPWRVREIGGALRPFFGRLKGLIWIPVLAQAQIVTEKIVASHLGDTAVAAVDYARLISETAIVLLAVPIGLASLPAFAVMPTDQVRRKLVEILRPLLVGTVLLSALAAGFATLLVTVMFGRGAFDATSIRITAAIFTGMGIGLWALLVNQVVLRVMNALGRIWPSVGVLAVATVLTIASRPLFTAWWGPFGLGLAVAVGAIGSAVVALALTGVLGELTRDFLLLAPAAAATIAAGVTVRAASIPVQLAVSVVAAIAWVGYFAAVPPLRRAAMAWLSPVVRKVRGVRGKQAKQPA